MLQVTSVYHQLTSQACSFLPRQSPAMQSSRTAANVAILTDYSEKVLPACPAQWRWKTEGWLWKDGVCVCVILKCRWRHRTEQCCIISAHGSPVVRSVGVAVCGCGLEDNKTGQDQYWTDSLALHVSPSPVLPDNSSVSGTHTSSPLKILAPPHPPPPPPPPPHRAD